MDGLEPDCEGCEFEKISPESMKVLDLYDLACPWGELDFKGLEMAFDDLGIRRFERRKYKKRVIKVHRIIRKHYEQE